MRDVDRNLKCWLTRPLTKKHKHINDLKSINAALDRIDRFALGEGMLPQVSSFFTEARQRRTVSSQRNPEYVKAWVNMAHSLYDTRRFSTQEYVFFVCLPVIQLHDDRWLSGQYNEELGPISEAIDAVKKKHGLSSDEDWYIGKGPKEDTNLNKKYGAVLEKRLIGVLREFGLNELADLRETQPAEFDRLFERGRRSFAHKGEYALALKDVIDRYVEDAHRAASANIYSSAVLSLAAGVEGLLLMRCLRSKHKACSIAKSLSKRSKPQITSDPTTWTFQNLIDVCSQAGWFRQVESKVAIYNPAGLAHMLRLMRNYIHPSKYARERPWSEIDERDYNDAEAIYVILLSALGKKK